MNTFTRITPQHRQELLLAEQIITTDPDSAERQTLYKELRQQLKTQGTPDPQSSEARLSQSLAQETAPSRDLLAQSLINDLLEELDYLTMSSPGWMRRFERLREELDDYFAEFADTESALSPIQGASISGRGALVAPFGLEMPNSVAGSEANVEMSP